MKKRLLIPGLLLILISVIAGKFVQNKSLAIAQSASCPVSLSISPQNQYANGTVNFVATAAQGYYLTRSQFVLFNGTTSNFAGNPVYGSSSTQSLSTIFNTVNVPNGSYGVKAEVNFGNSAGTNTIQPCNTAIVPMEVFNGELHISIKPNSWSGPTNAPPIPIEVHAGLQFNNGTAQDITSQASYEWSTTIGSITNFNGNKANFNPGPQSGEGSLSVRVSYRDKIKHINIPLKVQSYTTQTTYPTPTNTDGTPQVTSNTDQSGNTRPPGKNTVVPPEQLKQGDSVLTDCLVSVFGEGAYKERIADKKRLSFGDIATTDKCFEQRGNIIPVNLAPVEPDKVKNLPVKKALTVKQIEYALTSNGKESIVLNGTADPDKTVVIYIFSEPLVLATKTDKSGKWTYTLENPMEPGDHEAYVTVEGDDASPVRSSGFGFSVATSSKSKHNPLGLSFNVQQKVDPKYYYIMYSSLVALIVLVAGMGIWLFARHKHNRQPPTIGLPTPNAS